MGRALGKRRRSRGDARPEGVDVPIQETADVVGVRGRRSNRRGDERDPIGLAVRRRRARERVAAAYARMILRVVLHGAGGISALDSNARMDASRGVRFWDGVGVGNGNRTRRRGLGVRLAIRASSTRSARDARRRALDASARRRTQPATRGVDGGAGAVSDATRGGYRREPGLRRGSLRRAGAPRGGRRARIRAGDVSSSTRGCSGEHNLLRAAAADVSRTSAAALAWVERTLRETVAGMVSETRDDDGRRTRRACARKRMMRYVARLRREGRKIQREVRRCRGTRVAGRGALCRRARGIAERLCPPKQ